MAQTYISLGSVQEAQENIKIIEQQSDSKLIDNADKAMLYSTKAKLFLIGGQYEEALKQIKNSIQGSISNGLSPDAVFLAIKYLIKVEILNSLGKYQEALDQIERVYEIQKRVKNETNPIFGRIYTQKARALLGLGEKDKALEYVKKALEIFRNNDKNFAERQMPMVTNPAIVSTPVEK